MWLSSDISLENTNVLVTELFDFKKHQKTELTTYDTLHEQVGEGRDISVVWRYVKIQLVTLQVASLCCSVLKRKEGAVMQKQKNQSVSNGEY